MSRFPHILCLTLVLSIFSISCSTEREAPLAKRGVLSLTHWDFENDGVTDLNGEWEFYWNQLLAPLDFSKVLDSGTPTYFVISDKWNNFRYKNRDLPGEGFATFRLTVRISDPGERLAVKILDMGTAYTLWVNGVFLVSNGVVGDSRESSRPCYLPKIAGFTPDSETITFVLQVSNFSHKKGGVWKPIWIGKEEQIRKKREVRLAFEVFLFGSLIIMGVYHLGLYVLRRKDPSTLFFGLVCVLIAFRTILTGERFFILLFPRFNWELFQKFEYLSFYLSAPLFFLFLSGIFPEFSKRTTRSLSVISLLFALVTIIFPVRLFSHFMIPFQIVFSAYCLFGSYLLILAIKNKREGAIAISTVTILFLATIFHEILSVNELVYPVNLAPVGLFIFIFGQSIVLSSRFSNAFNEVELMSAELTRVDKLKDEFLINTSHELRTPLHGIYGIAEALLDGAGGQLSDEQRKNVEIIASSGKRLSNLVNDILDFSRLKNRDLFILRRAVDLRSVVGFVITLLKPLALAKKIFLINAVPEEFPAVYADEERLEQILNNLMGNAVKFSESGSIRVSAELRESVAYISVRDEGPGIEEERSADMFKTFESSDCYAGREQGGSGLGLAITKNLVELHGGRIFLDRDYQNGSRFVFSLPVAKGDSVSSRLFVEELGSVRVDEMTRDPKNCRRAPVPRYYENADRRKRWMDQREVVILDDFIDTKIVVADDDPVILQAIASSLKLSGIEVDVVFSGEECLKRLEINKPDVVLLDVMMPGLNGYDTAREIRKTYSKEELPIIFLSAKKQASDLVNGYSAGGNDYILKPLSKNELFARIGFHLKLTRSIKSLVEMEEKLRTIFENVTDGVFLSSASGGLLKANPAFSRIAGVDVDQVSKTNLFTLLADRGVDIQRKRELLEVLCKRDVVSGFEFEFRSLEGKRTTVALNVKSIKDDEHEPNYYVGIVQDITEKKMNEALRIAKESAEKANKSKSEFLTNMSHELKTPMQGILGFAKLGLKRAHRISRDKIRSYFYDIYSNGQRLLLLLNDLLDLSELDQDGIRYDFRRHSVSEIVEAALIEFEPIIREKQFRVHFAKPDFTDSCVLDEGKILQVIRNILTNAFEYSAVGGEIKIEIQRNETNYQVSIYDDGVGIPEGELETIFEKFVQSTRTKDGSGGTGLGLSISQKIITDHHGRIWAEKNGDGGTIIRFQLPNHQAP